MRVCARVCCLRQRSSSELQADTQNGDFPVWFPIFMNEGGGRELFVTSSGPDHQGGEQRGEWISVSLSLAVCVSVSLSHNIKARFKGKKLAIHGVEGVSGSSSSSRCEPGYRRAHAQPRLAARVLSSFYIYFLFSPPFFFSVKSETAQSAGAFFLLLFFLCKKSEAHYPACVSRGRRRRKKKTAIPMPSSTLSERDNP